MKLKDKFDNSIMRHDLGRNEIEETKEQCAKIAEEFAIDFAEWINKHENRLGYHEDMNKWYYYDLGKWVDTKELIEMFKKEKGL